MKHTKSSEKNRGYENDVYQFVSFIIVIFSVAEVELSELKWIFGNLYSLFGGHLNIIIISVNSFSHY
jgi:hypothetical protein